MNSSSWTEIVSALGSFDVEVCVNAANRLHVESSIEDVPALLSLLRSADFLSREAAAWPLAELTGPMHLPELLLAYQRGFDEGQDNDGFTAALLEIASLYPAEAKPVLLNLGRTLEEPLRGHAAWLLEHCEAQGAR